MDEQLTREDSKRLGLPTYNDLEFCDNGHMSEKYTVSGKCVACCKDRIQEYSDDREKFADKQKNSRLMKERKMYNQKERLPYINARRTITHYRRRAKVSPEGMDHNEFFSHEEILSVYDKQNGECAGCFISFEEEPFETDHIQNLSTGGKNTIDNIQLLCKSCNRVKDNRPQAEWLSELRYRQVIDCLSEIMEEEALVN